MAIPTFTAGYPQNGSSLGSSKAVIRNNLDGTFQTLTVDHYNQNQSNAGYHNVIHQVDQGVLPTAIPGVNQVFSMVPPSNVPNNGDVQLFSMTGGGGLSQLTGGTVGVDGYQWIGGVLFQWGTRLYDFSTFQNTIVAVDFPIDFPTTLFNVQATLRVNGFSNNVATITVDSNSLAVGGFTASYAVTNATGSYTGFYWTAIGN